MKKEIICFENVKKNFSVGKVTTDVLNGVDFKIDQGEFVIIVGTSGAGKSTILNLLGGMDNLSSGKIMVEGENIAAYSEKQMIQYRAEKIGFVFQFYNLIPNLNVKENVLFGSEVKKDTLNWSDILEKVNMQKKIDAFPSTLSGGEQQRVAIARAIAKNPLILLCDEPTGALDYKTGKQVLECIEKINREMGMTVVLVTHNEAICPMADKVINVHNGIVKDVQVNDEKISVSELEW